MNRITATIWARVQAKLAGDAGMSTIEYSWYE